MPPSVSDTSFDNKDDARSHVWQRLKDEKLAAFPFPIEGRIPNFKGAEQAVKRLMRHGLFENVKRIKVNPDSPQRFVRAAALAAGITVYVPTPRLKGGFKKLDPEQIAPEDHEEAAALSNMDAYAQPVALSDMPQLDVIVMGSVAVTEGGRRCGKGEGYADLEFAILRELGHEPVPVATTVHEAQIVGSFPSSSHDVPLSLIVTPERAVEVTDPGAAPAGIDWSKLSDADIDEMPILKELKRS